MSTLRVWPASQKMRDGKNTALALIKTHNRMTKTEGGLYLVQESEVEKAARGTIVSLGVGAIGYEIGQLVFWPKFAGMVFREDLRLLVIPCHDLWGVYEDPGEVILGDVDHAEAVQETPLEESPAPESD